MTPSVRLGAPQRHVLTWTVALAALAAVTAVLLALRVHLNPAHIALSFLLVVLVGSATGGRVLGFTLAVLAFVLFNYFFLPPYDTLAIENPFDWIVLAAFLATSIVATQLLDRARERAEEARLRAVEVERLAVLGSETLNAGRAEDALGAIADVIRGTLQVDCCEIYLEQGTPPVYVPVARAGNCGAAAPLDAASLAAWVALRGAPAAEYADRTTAVGWDGTANGATPWEHRRQWRTSGDVRVMLAPLHVRSRTVGVLRIAHAAPIVLDPAQERFLDVLAYYAALGVERVRLVAEADRAEALRQADELKNALIAGVSHDLRTPLTTIKALAHGLARQGYADAASIEEEADLLNRIVADLLDLSRLNAGGMPVHLELNAADDLIGAVMHHVRGLLSGREVHVRRDANDALLFGTFDMVQSLRVLANLVDNALRHAPPPAPVELFVARRGATLVFSVADRGPGIPPEERERVFEPFYRPPGARADVGGAGLGLAIARRLAEAQGGTVRYEPRPGGGSVFAFELRAADAPVIEESV
jgi:two-component system sensor histidine kinase KdpD